MKEDADDFLEKVESEGKLKRTFARIDVPLEANDRILIYEYNMNGKDYEIVIHKCKQNYVNYYFKVL